MKTTTTTFTCDRCGTRKDYEHVPGDSRNRPNWDEEWASYFAPQVALLGSGSGWIEPQDTCMGCLTDDERESLISQRRALEDMPF